MKRLLVLELIIALGLFPAVMRNAEMASAWQTTNNVVNISSNADSLQHIIGTRYDYDAIAGYGVGLSPANGRGSVTFSVTGSPLLEGRDTTYFIRTGRLTYLFADSVATIAAVRTAIFLTGLTTSHRAWVVWSDSISGTRHRGSPTGVCKANSLCVFTDTTAGTINYQIFK